MPIREDQKYRLMDSIRRAGDKGRTEKSLLYSEERFHGLGAEFTRQTLEILISTGDLRKASPRKRKFKTISELERKQVVKYYVNH